MNIGIKGTQELIVSKKDSANFIGSGNLEVFATPALIALVEKTAWTSVAPFLIDEESTVGTKVNIKHISSTPLGMKVTCNTELIEIDRKRLVFSVKVFDEKGLIAEGIHERFVVNGVKFYSKTQEKKN